MSQPRLHAPSDSFLVVIWIFFFPLLKRHKLEISSCFLLNKIHIYQKKNKTKKGQSQVVFFTIYILGVWIALCYIYIFLGQYQFRTKKCYDAEITTFDVSAEIIFSFFYVSENFNNICIENDAKVCIDTLSSKIEECSWFIHAQTSYSL